MDPLLEVMIVQTNEGPPARTNRHPAAKLTDHRETLMGVVFFALVWTATGVVAILLIWLLQVAGLWTLPEAELEPAASALVSSLGGRAGGASRA
jgi:hypothetical protein